MVWRYDCMTRSLPRWGKKWGFMTLREARQATQRSVVKEAVVATIDLSTWKRTSLRSGIRLKHLYQRDRICKSMTLQQLVTVGPSSKVMHGSRLSQSQSKWRRKVKNSPRNRLFYSKLYIIFIYNAILPTWLHFHHFLHFLPKITLGSRCSNLRAELHPMEKRSRGVCIETRGPPGRFCTWKKDTPRAGTQNGLMVLRQDALIFSWWPFLKEI